MRDMWGEEWNNQWPAQTLRVIRGMADCAERVNMDVLDSFTLDFSLKAQTTPAAAHNPDIAANGVRIHFEEVFSSATDKQKSLCVVLSNLYSIVLVILFSSV